TSAGTTVSAGATLEITPHVSNNTAAGISVAEPITISGSGITDPQLIGGPAGAIFLPNVGLNPTETLTGLITLAGDATVRVNADEVLVLQGRITGPGGLTKTGTGTLTFSGTLANNYTGNTTVNEGTLRLDKAIFDGAIPGGVLTIGDDSQPATVVLD